MKLLLHKNSRTLQHTCVSSGSCFTAGRPKFSCLTSADQSPLPDSVVHGPSVSLVSGTFSVNSLVWKSWVTSAGGRLVDSVSLLAIESVLSILHQLQIIQLHRQTQRFTIIRLYVALPRFCRDMTQGRDIVCHTVAGTHAGTYVPRLILGLSASIYFSKRGAYWDRLCRDVVGWLSRACTVAKRCILGL